VVTAARDGTARVWDAASGKQAFVLQPLGRFPTATFSPSGNRVLTAATDKEPTLWDAQTGTKVVSVESLSPGGYVISQNSLAGFSPDGRSFTMAHTAGGISQNVISI